MRRTCISLMVVAALLTAPAASQAEEEGRKLGVSFDATYVSRWMCRGAEVWSEDGGFFETTNLHLWGTGFKAAVTHRSATGSGWVNKQRLDYMLCYSGTAFDSKPCKTEYTAGYVYKNWYDKLANAAGNSKDFETWVFEYSFPNLLRRTGLVPYGVTTYDHPAKSDDGFGKHWYGWVHGFGLTYDLRLPDLPSPLHLTSEVAYNGGFLAADHDWSYSTFGISTELKLSENIRFVPAIYHQISMDDSVCNRDVTYCTTSMKYKF